jgi:hypothetical protein
LEWSGTAGFALQSITIFNPENKSRETGPSDAYYMHVMDQKITNKETDIDLKSVARDLVFYREGVETLMRLKSASPISNGEPAHAAILFEIFFKNAENHVRIFCQRLSQRVFGSASLIEAAKWALDRGTKISVIYQKEMPEHGQLLEELRKSGSVVVRAPEEARGWELNFATMDDQAYRIERDREECKAQAVMNDPDMSKKLVRKFDELVLETKLAALLQKSGGDLISAAAAV